jgi:branched-chain amino acid transport system permease protein
MAVLAVGMAILFGIITDYAAFRPVRAKSVTAVLITSFAFSNLLQNAALLFISPRPRNVPLPDIFSQTVSIGVRSPRSAISSPSPPPSHCSPASPS